MFTSVDKALVSAIMAGVFIANNVFGQHFGLTQDQANSIAAVLQVVLTYAVPNKVKE